MSLFVEVRSHTFTIDQIIKYNIKDEVFTVFLNAQTDLKEKLSMVMVATFVKMAIDFIM